MSTRAAPGPQLSTGRLRVDAARAIAKLREYQLVDRTAWILEAIRAAVASGATAITLSGDANDVWLAWEGPAWPAEDLPRLFDELVSPEPTEERHHLRLLAAAVNSALGLWPAYVDLYTASAEGTQRARYTPDVLIETADLEDSALRKVTAEPVKPPAELGYATGMLVHLRRRAAIGMLTHLFWHRDPPELAAARAACRNLAVPIAIGETTYSRAHDKDDLVRVPFDGDLDGFVALCDPTTPSRGSTIEIAERGVLLATYEIDLWPANDDAPRAPLRVFVDAKRMPTNASRSQVRREVPPISTAETRAPQLVDKLVVALAAELMDPACDPKRRHAALQLVAAHVAGPEWTLRAFTEKLGAFAKVPLLRDATGERRIVGHTWSGHVYTGSEPLEPELGPWVSSILWIPPADPARALVAGATLDHYDTKRRVKWAKRQRKAHRKFFAHAPTTVNLVVKQPPRLRMSLGAKLPGGSVPASWFENLTGEIAISLERGDGEVLLLFQGRPIERVVMPSAIGFDAVIDAVHLTPGEGYKSVARDAYYTIVERALQAALVCGAEAIAARLNGLELGLAGFTEGPASPPDVEARVIRTAMGIARDLKLPRSGLLSKAPAWPTIDGEWVDFGRLAGERVIGTATSSEIARPRGRLVIAGGSALLDKLLLDTKVVDYDKRRSTVTPAQVPAALAQQLALQNGFALAIDSEAFRGAVATTKAPSPSIHIYHLGHRLEQLERKVGLWCTIAVDSDEVVPAADWNHTNDLAGVHERDYRAQEVALLRAALLTLAGERPAELFGPPITSLDNTLIAWAFGVMQRSPQQIDQIDPSIDDALISRVKSARIIHVLGERDLISIDDLVKRFPLKLYYVNAQSAPVEGFSPMVATPFVAEVVGRLAGLAVADGTEELAKQRKLAERNARISKHRRQPSLQLEYPFAGEPFVELIPSDELAVKGSVGIGRNRLELDIRIDSRPFVTLIRSEELPLYAVIDLDIKHADDQFTGLSEPVTNQLLGKVKMMVPALLAKLAKERPTALANPGFPRKLLYKWLAGAKIAMFPKLRDELCAAPAFYTVNRTRISLDDAATANRVLHTTSFNHDWLEVGSGEAASAYETGVLQLMPDDPELSSILDILHPGRVVDVTEEVTKLQSRRRMSRGLIPTPSLPHVPNELKRKLSELGDIGARLGGGEIGLVPDTPCALIHDHGTLRQRLTLDVAPAIQIALESPELLDADAEPGSLDLAGDVADQLARLRNLTARPARPSSQQLAVDTQELALRLLRDVIASGADLPWKIRASIRAGVLANRIPREQISALDLFEQADGTWVNLDALIAQIQLFGDAWVVTRPTLLVPLDPRRKVFRMTLEDIAASLRGNVALFEAEQELQLDDEARRNQGRAPVQSFDHEAQYGTLARIDLPGDGKTSVRGVVAPLLPHAAGQRGVVSHRQLVPFSVMPDPCRWPTRAILDDARFQPDRTWDRPVTDAVWIEAMAQVTALSERILTSLVPQHEGSLAHLHLGPGVALGPEIISSKLQLRGAVWLVGAPRSPSVAIEIFDPYGQHLFTPERALGMGGTIYVHAPEGWARHEVMTELVPRLYGQLVTQLLGKHKLTTKPPSDLIAAHVATAIALEAIPPAAVGPMLFPCFRPEPLDAHGLLKIFDRRDAVSVLPIAELEAELIAPDAVGVVEDGSELSQAVIARLLVRGRYQRPKPRPLPPIPAVPPPSVEKTPPPPPKPTPVEIHPIQIVVDAVYARVSKAGAIQFNIAIADSKSPIIGFARNTVLFAGGDSRLHAIANALRSNSPWATDAIDALSAHAITILDEARSEVNRQTVRDVLSALLTD